MDTQRARAQQNPGDTSQQEVVERGWLCSGEGKGAHGEEGMGLRAPASL